MTHESRSYSLPSVLSVHDQKVNKGVAEEAFVEHDEAQQLVFMFCHETVILFNVSQQMALAILISEWECKPGEISVIPNCGLPYVHGDWNPPSSVLDRPDRSDPRCSLSDANEDLIEIAHCFPGTISVLGKQYSQLVFIDP